MASPHTERIFPIWKINQHGHNERMNKWCIHRKMEWWQRVEDRR